MIRKLGGYTLMAYGRLDVFWPDGQFKTYVLSDSTVSIGRSSGNAIPLESDTLSRYHDSITYQDGEVRITDLDSANGTFVDGVRLAGNQPHTLYGGEEIEIGELRLVYHFLDETPTRPITVPEEVTRRIELAEAPFYIDIEIPDQGIPPGAHITARLSITNTGGDAERFRVDVSGVPKDWARIDRPELEIAPQQSADVLINFKPRRRSDSTPGDYPVQIGVYPKVQPELMLKASIQLHILPFGGFGMALERNHLKPGDRFRLYVHNQGSAPLPLNFSARDLGSSLTFSIPNAHLTLAPGQRTVIQGQAKPKSTHFFGEAREHSFDVIARSGDAAAFTVAQRAYVDEKPPLPAWAAFAISGIAVAVVLIILVGLFILLQPAPTSPAINSFQVSTTKIAQGQPLAVSWAVANANTVGITVNSTPIAVAANATSAQIDTSALDGAVTVVLTASQGSKQTQASETVQVFKPITISAFKIDPPQVVLYVAQTVTVSWSADGATTTSISGLNGFTSTPINSTYGASASVSVAGIPTAPLMLTLTAQNSDTTITQPLTVQMITPQCTASGADATLYASPSSGDQVVGKVPQGTIVVVDAQDTGSQWLRVQLAGGAHGWGQRTAFTCADNFSVDDLSKVILPTPSVALTIVPTLSTGTSPTVTVRPSATLALPTTAPTFTPTHNPVATAGG